jgi:hypothetical protein
LFGQGIEIAGVGEQPIPMIINIIEAYSTRDVTSMAATGTNIFEDNIFESRSLFKI